MSQSRKIRRNMGLIPERAPRPRGHNYAGRRTQVQVAEQKLHLKFGRSVTRSWPK